MMSIAFATPVWPPAPSGPPPGQNDARLTAQKAFFQAARSGQTVATAPTNAPAPSGAPVARVLLQTSDDPPAEQPLRPGSIIDIRV